MLSSVAACPCRGDFGCADRPEAWLQLLLQHLVAIHSKVLPGAKLGAAAVLLEFLKLLAIQSMPGALPPLHACVRLYHCASCLHWRTVSHLFLCVCVCAVAGSVYNTSSHHQQVILQFKSAVPLPPLQPVLKLAFSYHLMEGLDGFYRSTFIGNHAVQVYL